MTQSEWEKLIQAFGGGSVRGAVDGLLRAVLEVQEPAPSRELQGRAAPTAGAGSASPQTQQRLPAPLSGSTEVRVSYPASLLRGAEAAPKASRSSSASTGAGSESSTASDVVRTVGMLTGAGPVITGLLKLFGGGGDDAPPRYSPIPFSLPEQVSVEAGLASDRSFVDVGYAAQGGPRPTSGNPSASKSAPQIQINVNAMDSRSFTDHSDEIARAVRDAMLRSHSLNDVVSEL
jgi:hypothetical protein